MRLKLRGYHSEPNLISRVVKSKTHSRAKLEKQVKQRKQQHYLAGLECGGKGPSEPLSKVESKETDPPVCSLEKGIGHADILTSAQQRMCPQNDLTGRWCPFKPLNVSQFVTAATEYE